MARVIYIWSITGRESIEVFAIVPLEEGDVELIWVGCA